MSYMKTLRRAALEWTLELYEYKQKVNGINWDVAFKDKIKEELE